MAFILYKAIFKAKKTVFFEYFSQPVYPQPSVPDHSRTTLRFLHVAVKRSRFPDVCNTTQSLLFPSGEVLYAYGYGLKTRIPHHW